MRAIILFDGSPTSRLNLEIARQDATQTDKALLLAFKFFGEQNNQATQIQNPTNEQSELEELVAQLKAEDGFADVKAEVVYCWPLELTKALLVRCQQWQADTIYIPLNSDNSAEYAPKIAGSWRQWLKPGTKAKNTKQTKFNSLAKLDELDTAQLLAKAHCRLVLTDNAQMTMRLEYTAPVKRVTTVKAIDSKVRANL